MQSRSLSAVLLSAIAASTLGQQIGGSAAVPVKVHLPSSELTLRYLNKKVCRADFYGELTHIYWLRDRLRVKRLIPDGLHHGRYICSVYEAKYRTLDADQSFPFANDGPGLPPEMLAIRTANRRPYIAHWEFAVDSTNLFKIVRSLPLSEPSLDLNNLRKDLHLERSKVRYERMDSAFFQISPPTQDLAQDPFEDRVGRAVQLLLARYGAKEPKIVDPFDQGEVQIGQR